jgi:hypothetical protein
MIVQNKLECLSLTSFRVLGSRIDPSGIHLLEDTCGLYYKPMTIINDNSRVITKLETSLTDDARVVIYDHHMFIVQATGLA